MKFIGFLLVFCCCAAFVKAQEQLPRPLAMGKNDTIKTYVTDIEGELVPMIVTPEIKIVDVRIFKTKADRDAYYRLRYNVYKVMPYYLAR